MKLFLRRVFLENLGLKSVALALAGVLFLYVQGERQRDAVTGALVKVTLVPPRGKVLTVDPVDKLAVTLRGQRSAIQRLMAEGLAPMEIDLSGRQPGPLHFTSDMIHVPRGMTVESIQPPQIDVAWEDRVVKTVPVVPRLAGKPASGYRVTQVTPNPKEAIASGPRSAIESLQEVELREVRVDGRDETVEFTVPIQLQRKFVSVRPESARVLVEIAGDLVTKRFSAVPVKVLNPPNGVDIELTQKTAQEVLVEGPAPAVAKLDSSDLKVVVDLRDMGEVKPGSYLRPGRVEVPRGVRVLATIPPSFALIVRRKVREKNED